MIRSLAVVLAVAPLAAAVPPAAGAADSLVMRSPEGRLQVAAQRAEQPVRIDGVLDDAVWAAARAVSGFVQAEPDEGKPASEQTEVRVAFDADNLYVAAYCHDSAPSQLKVTGIRKDFQSGDQDSFEVALDTFHDRRNGYIFMTNPEGARSDQQFANEGRENNLSWDAVWWVATRRVDDGWTVEMQIPFKSLRFERSAAATWGVNFARRIRRKNEYDYWSPVPRAYTFSRVSLAGELVGLDAGRPGRDLRLKPYAAARSLRPTGGDRFEQEADLGLDFKAALTPSLTLDATLNPDFAQAEADEQQVNLTQFSQFFPEKRDFFLENSGTFYVGDAARNNRINPTPTPDEDLLPFFSRRIGLAADGTPIPITGGARLTGRAAGVSLGGLLVHTRQQGREPANLWGVLRLRRNFAKNSDVGGFFMTRQATSRDDSWNRVYGADLTLRFFGHLDWSSYGMLTESPGRSGGQAAWRTSINREGNFLHAKGGLMYLGPQFNDELGYYRRVGVRKSFLDAGVRPRPAWLQKRGIRELHPHLTWNYFDDLDGRLVAKRMHNGFTFFLNNGAFFELSANPQFETLERPFRIHRRFQPLPAGVYGWRVVQLRGNSDPSRPVYLALDVGRGGLWGGRQKIFSPTLRVRPSYRFFVQAQLQRTTVDIDRIGAHFVQSIFTFRSNYSFNRNMFLDALVQYDVDQKLLNANLRFNLIHRPLSDLFVVFNEQRFETPDAPNAGRSVIVKFTRMMSF